MTEIVNGRTAWAGKAAIAIGSQNHCHILPLISTYSFIPQTRSLHLHHAAQFSQTPQFCQGALQYDTDVPMI